MADIRLRRAGYSLFDDEELIASRNLTLSLLDYGYLTEASAKAGSKPLAAGAQLADARIMRPYLVQTAGAQVADVGTRAGGKSLTAGAQVADVFDPVTQWIRAFTAGAQVAESRAMHPSRPDAAGAQVADTRNSAVGKANADGAQAAEVFDRVVTWYRDFTAGAAVGESALLVMAFVRAFTAGAQMADARVLQIGKNLVDFTPLLETYARDLQRALAAGAAGNALAALHPHKPLSAGAQFSDVALPGFALWLAENLPVTMLQALVIGKPLSDLAEALADYAASIIQAVGDGAQVAASPALWPNKSLTLGAQFTDTVRPSFALWLAEVLQVPEVMTRAAQQVLAAGVAAGEGMSKAVDMPITDGAQSLAQLANALGKPLTAGAQVTDSLLLSWALWLLEALQVTDNAPLTVGKGLTELLALWETYTRLIGKVPSDGALASEAHASATRRAFADGAQVADLLQILRSLSLTDGVQSGESVSAPYVVLDNFNRADEVITASPNWAHLDAYCTIYPDDVWVKTNAAQPFDLNSTNDVYWTPGLGTPAHECGLVFLSGDQWLSTVTTLWARVAQPGLVSLTGYQLYVYFTENPLLPEEVAVQVYRYDDCGTWTNIGQTLTSQLPGDAWRFRADGAAFTAYRNGAAVLTVTDATYAAGDYIGLGVYGTNTRVDDFGGAGLVSTGRIMHVFKVLLEVLDIPDALALALAAFITDNVAVADIFGLARSLLLADGVQVGDVFAGVVLLLLTLVARSTALTLEARATALELYTRLLALDLPEMRNR